MFGCPKPGTSGAGGFGLISGGGTTGGGTSGGIGSSIPGGSAGAGCDGLGGIVGAGTPGGGATCATADVRIQVKAAAKRGLMNLRVRRCVFIVLFNCSINSGEPLERSASS